MTRSLVEDIAQRKYIIIEALCDSGDKSYRVIKLLSSFYHYRTDISLKINTANDSFSYLFTSVCNIPGADSWPVLSCSGMDSLRIRWPTKLVFTADLVSVPAAYGQPMESRITACGVTLDITVLAATLP